MLFLVFQIGKDAYAVSVNEVAQVLPLVQCKQIPLAPKGFAGLFNYHGAPVPLVDLTELALGRASEAKMNTRIILMNYSQESGEKRLLGVIVEKVTGTIRREPADFADSGMSAVSCPYLGPITTENGRIIQWIEMNRLLPADLRVQLSGDLVSSN